MAQGEKRPAAEMEQPMSDLETLLERVAQEAQEPPNAYLFNVLKRRLLPLLEAGQAMRDCNYINTTNSLAWDAAKQRAMEE